MQFIVALLFLSALFNFLLIYFQYKKNRKVKPGKKHDPEEVGKFYDSQTVNFLKVYGEVIQAFRTKDITKLLDYQIESIGLKKGQMVLDAGCGVCGPARYFAKQAGVSIEALTISADQVQRAEVAILNEGLNALIKVKQGDYHQLADLYPRDHFDAVYFLESFGHAKDHQKVIDSAWNVLKAGGTLYIKDLFIKEASVEAFKPGIQREIENINRAYRYNVADLYEIIHFLRTKGFILGFIKTIDFTLDEFENLTISNEFQELTGINKIENLKEYVFPVDFFEIKCIKPWNPLDTGNSRYFLQNMYHMQVLNKKVEDL